MKALFLSKEQRFGRLTVTGQLILVQRPDGKRPYRFWPVRCDCGTELSVQQGHLVSGHTESCGCFHIESIAIHGESNSPTYRSWCKMIQRCTNPKDKHFSFYGGRGIQVCLSWRLSYEAFRSDMGARPIGLTLDRIDSNGNYEKSNCRWATREAQQNNMRSNRFITVHGEAKTVSQWAKHFGIAPQIVTGRMKWGWKPLRALTTPPGKNGRHHAHVTGD